MNEDNIVTAAETNRRFADAHKELRRSAVCEINKLIRKAERFPIEVPRALLTDVPEVRAELLRKLREESGWRVTVGPDPDAIQTDNDGLNYYLWHPHIRHKEGK